MSHYGLGVEWHNTGAAFKHAFKNIGTEAKQPEHLICKLIQATSCFALESIYELQSMFLKAIDTNALFINKSVKTSTIYMIIDGSSKNMRI